MSVHSSVRDHVRVRISQDAQIRVNNQVCARTTKAKAKPPKPQGNTRSTPEYNLYGPNRRDLRFLDSVRDPGVHWHCHWVCKFVVQLHGLPLTFGRGKT